MPAVLVVDDEANIRRMVASLLESEGYRVLEAPDGRAALEVTDAEDPDLVLLDLAMPELDGLGALSEIRKTWPELPVVMMSGRASLSDAVQATKLGAFHFIEKPLNPEAVLLTVQRGLELRRARELSRTLAADLGSGNELVGTSPQMQEVKELIRQVAPTDARVLLTGESGTGKELVAAALHALSKRADGPLVRVNSAAIPRDLVESEIFGHERGAFTGATERRTGRFELADGGTLLLDEVAELGLEAQAKVLRVLETGEFERVGGEETIRTDVRVIAATHRDLHDEIRAGRFREDLFYRLHVIPIRLPALRERMADLPELATYFLDRLRERHGLRPPALSDDALVRLQAYEWPGNVRELANICERLTILYPGRTVGAYEIDELVAGASPARADAKHHGDHDADLDRGSLRERLDAFERRTLIATLEETGGNVAEAARLLETDRPNLYRRMKRLGVER